jgi:hypothetical protein
MTSLHARNPSAAAAASPQFERYQVTVTAIDTSKVGQANTDPRGIATTIDNFGKYRQIGVSTVVGSGAYPQVGELWVVDKSLGTWTFCSRQQPVLPVVSDAYTMGQGLAQLGILTVDPTWLPPVSPAPFPPPPVTTGSTLQTTVDHTGDVWVAKNGVRGGKWYRPRDVLRCHYTRAANFNFSTGTVTLGFDTQNTGGDLYGIYQQAAPSGFYALVPGIYTLFFQVCAAATAAGQWIQLSSSYQQASGIMVGPFAQNRVYAQSAANVTVSVTDSQPLAVGEAFVPQIIASTGLTGITSGILTYAWFQYWGTG